MATTSLSTVRTDLRRFLEEIYAGQWSDAELDSYISEAVQTFWDYIYDFNPWTLPVTIVDHVWLADTLELDLETHADFSSEAEWDILQIEQFARNEAEDVDNLPIVIEGGIPWEEINNRGMGVAGTHYDVSVYSSTTATSVHAWARRGNKIKMSPVPRVDTRFRFTLVKEFTLPSADGDDVLPDRFNRWVRLLIYEAAVIAKGRGSEDDNSVERLRIRTLDRMRKHMQRKGVAGTPTRRLGKI